MDLVAALGERRNEQSEPQQRAALDDEQDAHQS
jgi:hypothetical protein